MLLYVDRYKNKYNIYQHTKKSQANRVLLSQIGFVLVMKFFFTFKNKAVSLPNMYSSQRT